MRLSASPDWTGRDLTWFTADRGRVYAGAAAIGFVGVLARTILSQGGLYSGDGLPVGMDFASFWAASRLILKGVPAAVYHSAAHAMAQAAIVPAGHYEAFFYPPTYLLICLPLGLWPFFWSLAAFLVGTGAVFASAIRLAARSPWVVLAAVFSPAVLMNLLAGQNAMLTAAILGGGLTLMDRRPRLAGVILGLMAIKPHLALAVPVALLVSRRWTVLGSAAASAAALVALSAGVFGLDVWRAFLASTGHASDALENGLVRFSLFQSAFAAVRMAGGPVAAAYAVQGLCAIAALGTMIRAQMNRASPAVERSLIVLACLLTTPFVLHYDLLILMFPMVWLLTEWAGTDFPPWGKLVLLIAYVLPYPMDFWPACHAGLIGMAAMMAWLVRFGAFARRPRPAAHGGLPEPALS